MTNSISIRRLTLAFGGPLAAGLVLWVAGACADFSGPDDAAGGLPNILKATPSLSVDIQPVLDKRCAIGGCHSVRTKQGGLDLTAGHTYSNTVNVTAALVGNLGFKRIVPFNADTSWLYRLIADDASKRLGVARMPLAQTPLTANQIQNIRNWIMNGAPNN
jgi:hypothetical protein